MGLLYFCLIFSVLGGIVWETFHIKKHTIYSVLVFTPAETRTHTFGVSLAVALMAEAHDSDHLEKSKEKSGLKQKGLILFFGKMRKLRLGES